jgi:hypothetical protein
MGSMWYFNICIKPELIKSVQLAFPSPDHVLFLVVVLVFELRASHLLGRCSIAWAMPPDLFTLVIWDIGFCILPMWAWLGSSYFTFPIFTEMTKVHHNMQLSSIEMGSLESFVWTGLKVQFSQSQPPA